MTEKRRAHYSLSAIKAAFASPATLIRTFSATQGAEALGIEDADVVAMVQSLSSSNFYKSMTSYADSKTWQDVYRSSKDERSIYIKFTLNAQQQFLLVSFKEA